MSWSVPGMAGQWPKAGGQCSAVAPQHRTATLLADQLHTACRGRQALLMPAPRLQPCCLTRRIQPCCLLPLCLLQGEPASSAAEESASPEPAVEGPGTVLEDGSIVFKF